ncbi:MAG: cytochrome c biogenesis protein ResB [bacterium]|nr:cytochrome c biogenesis protein ResB [bacterium]
MEKEKKDTQKKETPHRSIESRFFGFFGSIKVTLVLFGLVIVASIIGTLIPQNESAQVYIHQYGIPLYQLFRITGIIDMYSSWWFITLLSLLGLTTVVCTYNRYTVLKRFLGAPQVLVPEHIFSNPKNSMQFKTKAEIAEFTSSLLHTLHKSGYQARSQTANERMYLFGEKGLLNRWGNLLVHISIVLILFGAIVGRFGFNYTLTAVEGETVAVQTPSPPWVLSMFKVLHPLGIHYTPKQQADFQFHLNKFEVETYPNSRQPKDFRSFITLIRNGQPRLEKIIRVNHPLTYQGITFYQNSYGETRTVKSLALALRDSQTKKELGTIPAEIGQAVPIPGQNLQIKVAKFFPDFTMDLASKQPTSKSDELNNPAALIEEYAGDKLVGNTWIFARFPSFHAEGKTSYTYELVDARFKLYSVLQVAKDPGVPLIYLGFTGLILGLLFTLFMEHRRVWVTMSKIESGTLVRFAGVSNRRVHQMVKELEKFRQQIE